MATANRKKLHKHFIKGRDPMAPAGDGGPNLLQQVTAGQKSSWEEEGRDGERGGDVGAERETISFSSLLFIQPVLTIKYSASYLLSETFSKSAFQ